MRLTTDNPETMMETMQNMVYIKDGYIFIRNAGEPFYEDIRLEEYIRQNRKEWSGFSDEQIQEMLCDQPTDPLELLYLMAVGFAHVREELKILEDEKELQEEKEMLIKNLQKRAHATATAKGWHDKKVSPVECLALVQCEISEAIEEVRKGKRMNEAYFSPSNPSKPEGVPSELADAVIRILDLSEEFGIDLEQAIAEKMAFNETRPYRHGGKKM